MVILTAIHLNFLINGGPIVTKLDGIKNPSVAQVNAALYGTSTKNNKNNAASSNQSSTNSTKSGKLAQTGQSNTGEKAGIVGAIAAMVSAAFVGVSKFIKRA